MTFEWIDLIEFFTFIQLLFLAVVAFNYKGGKRLSNRILSGFMASNALLIGHLFLSHFGWISPAKFKVLFCIGNSSYLLLMPFLYLYIRSLCYKDFHLSINHLLHAIPFVVISLFLLIIFLSTGEGTEIGVKSLSQNIAKIEYWSHKFILHIQIASYLVASAITLSVYRERLKDVYSSIEKIDLSWCNLLLIGFAAMWIIDLLDWILNSLHVTPPLMRQIFFTVSLLINLIFTLAVAYRGLVRLEGFSGIYAPAKYAASLMKASECKAIIQRLTTCMEKEKLYLRASITVEDLSKRLKVPTKQLSQTIHTGLSKNFYDFVNAYRIDEAKRRICDKHYQNQTLLAVAYDVGFNSKSVFNTAFKKYTGITPKEYKSNYSS
jgi:AraC-like DNA-binding protein